jgi:hypothetical protein
LGSGSSNDYVRSLALTCAVLTLLGAVALGTIDDGDARLPRRNARVLAGDYGGASPGADVPEPVLPLFPTTSTTKATKAASTTSSPSTVRAQADVGSVLPKLGVYTFSVAGNESATGGGTRALPPTMRLTAHRTGAAADEVILDSQFSDQHTEREVVGFRTDRLSLRQEAMTVAFGIAGRSGTTTYTPALPRVLVPLTANATRIGASEARDGSGALLRTEDWKITTVAQRANGWEVLIERTSRPGAAESLRDTYRGWFDPTRGTWVKWERHLHTQRNNGVAFSYNLDYTATLASFTAA